MQVKHRGGAAGPSRDRFGGRAHASLSSRLSAPWHFFVLVFCWTWLFWLLAVALATGVQTTLGRTLLYLGLLGPTLGGIGLCYLTGSRQDWREYWLRIVDPTRIRTRWYLVVIFFVPVLMALSVLLDIASGGRATLAQIGETVRPLTAAPSTIVPLVVGTLLKGPLPEELGWRGYILDRLQARWNALESSLILGATWALWHLPLFFIKGTYHHEQGAWSTWFWLFMAQVIAMAVIMTWIFNNTRRSTLAAILFHFVANLTYEFLNRTELTNFFSTLLWIAAAMAVVSLRGASTLARRE